MVVRSFYKHIYFVFKGHGVVPEQLHKSVNSVQFHHSFCHTRELSMKMCGPTSIHRQT